jgi:L-asparaginase/Glu-tRNA(Gln) amidotransferase subunit D
MKKRVIFMGGSLLLTWQTGSDKLGYSSTTEIQNYFIQLLGEENVEFKTVCLKESTELDDKDMSEMLDAINNSSTTEIIIIHGSLTAKKSASFIKNPTKTIVFVGGTAPFCIKNSAAPANIGAALAFLAQNPGSNKIFICKGNAEVMEYQPVDD